MIKTLSFIGILSLLVMSCQPKGDTGNSIPSKEYNVLQPGDWNEISGEGFILKYPAHWSNLGNWDEAEFVLLPPSQEGQLTTCTVNLMTEQASFIKDIRKYADLSLEQIEKHYPSLIMELDQNIKVGEYDGVEIVYTFQEGGTYKLKQMLFLQDGKGFVFTYGGEEKDFGQYVASFDSIMSTLKFD